MSDFTMVEIVVLPNGLGLGLPRYQTPGAAGMDLAVALPEGSDVIMEPGDTRLFGTGIKIAVPPGKVGLVVSRSGMAKKGIVVANSPGIIDSDYTGEVGLLMHNQSPVPFTLSRGMRLAQLIVAPYCRAEWIEVGTLRETARGGGGFGSTGLTEAVSESLRGLTS